MNATARKELNRRVKNGADIMKGHADEPELVRDVLADLMHYCTAKGISFTRELESAERHYTAEQAGDV